jgi:hypothetical protein
MFVRAILICVNGAPERNHGEEWNETEKRARQIIDAILQIILQADVDDVKIFFHSRRRI